MNRSKKTLPEIIYEGLNKHPGGLFTSTKRKGSWHTTDVETYKNKVHKFAMGLYKLGVRPGDKVAIHSENSTEWLISDLAILSIGAANVPIYPSQPGDQIKYILENSDAVAHIVSNDELFSETKPLIKEVKSIKAVISIHGSKHGKLKQFDEVMEMGEKLIEKEPDIFDKLRKEVKPDDLATLIYTSGTTGMPKGVMLSHDNIASNVMASLEKLPFPVEDFKGNNMLSYLPLSHVFERMIEYMYLNMGSRIYFIETIDEIRDDFKHVQPFFFATVPRLLEKIHTGVKVRGQEMSGLKKNLYYWALYRTENYDPEYPPSGLDGIKHKIADKLVYSKIRELFGDELKGMVSGGAALSPEVFKFINAIGFNCVQGYGLTETSPVITVQTPGEMRIGSSGKPLRNVQVEIADDQEILTKGPHVMKGYYKNEEKTKEVFTDDGWFKTGDIGKIDEDGFLFITDRKKSMFKLSTGKYVAPQNVENVISNSGFIDQIVVLGYQRKFCSALIIPSYDNVIKRLKRDGYTPDEPFSEDEKVRELIQKEVDKANKELSPWEKVKKFVLLEEPLSIDSGELTPTMKVKRSVVKENYEEEIESMYDEE
ncbi:AMP-dependent synthetase/ligase [Rhodohalobacter sp. 8-1]|uniref:AMP-dependent synthetase/ligase n=1 Tax=Rhodohalobacter sp. 8-1 TaxID=3131972 RepID=UPI0030ECCB22